MVYLATSFLGIREDILVSWQDYNCWEIHRPLLPSHSSAPHANTNLYAAKALLAVTAAFLPTSILFLLARSPHSWITDTQRLSHSFKLSLVRPSPRLEGLQQQPWLKGKPGSQVDKGIWKGTHRDSEFSRAGMKDNICVLQRALTCCQQQCLTSKLNYRMDTDHWWWG